jgi:hypothetical protein
MSTTPSTSPAKRRSEDVIMDTHQEFFIPKKKEVRNYGRVNLMLYPDITSEMTDQERSLAFQINSEALKNSRAIKFSQKLSIFGESTGCSTILSNFASISFAPIVTLHAAFFSERSSP